MNRRALVTGAAGFIGSHLTEKLVSLGFSVRAMTHYNFQNNWGWLESLSRDILDHIEIFSTDICDPFAVSEAVEGVDIVFHLASLIAIPHSYRAPASYVDTNIRGTLNVLQACRHHGVGRLIHTSTSETYGTAQYIPIDEKHPLVGQSPYSATKIAADKLAEAFHLSFDLPVTTIRPFNTFGPRQSARAVIPTIITQALSGSPRIRLGSLEPIRDLNYVKDTVAAFVAASEKPDILGSVINVGRGEGISVGELAQVILDICSSDAQIESSDERIRPENSEVQQLICDSNLARRVLLWSPVHSLRQGLEETVSWFEQNLHHYKSSLYNT